MVGHAVARYRPSTAKFGIRFLSIIAGSGEFARIGHPRG